MRAPKKNQGNSTLVHVFINEATGKVYYYEDIIEKLKKIYVNYNFFELIDRLDKLKKLSQSESEIKKAFKPFKLQELATKQIAVEIGWLPKYAYEEAFPIGTDFYLCDEYIKPLKDAYKLSRTNIPILLYGGSGSGKESFAYFIGKNSLGRKEKYRAISIVGLSEQFVHSELFGHMRGSFTGATDTRDGILEECDGGTIFFDEIDKLDLPVQAKLLRYLETQEFSRLGENKIHKSDCRFVFATSKNLLDLVNDGKFLLDFYYRITGATIRIPSLKEIIDSDTKKAECLFNFFYWLFCFDYGTGNEYRFDVWYDILKRTDNLRLWFEYEWYGNLREFSNYMKRNLILKDWGNLPNSRKENDEGYNINKAIKAGARFPLFTEIEKDYLSQLMKSVNGIKKKASDISGLSLSTINRKLKEYKIS